LYHSDTPERLGAIYTEPSDMCLPDRVMLYALVRGLRPERVLEIGVRWGGGARIIAAALEDTGGPGRAVGIDPATDAFRPPARVLYGRYDLLRGYSPGAIPDAVAKLGGPIDLAVIDAMHTHDHVLADVRGVLPQMAPGGHILFHDTFHQGIDQAVTEALVEDPRLVDCGFLTRHPQFSRAPVAYQGLRLVRVGTPISRDVIAGAYERAGHAAPEFSPDLLNWDGHWNRIKDKPNTSGFPHAPLGARRDQAMTKG
jgi:cephalosporin hydroxylase